jgi:hypothetical protein
LKQNIQRRGFGLTAEGLDKPHAMSVEMLELLKRNSEYAGEDRRRAWLEF